MGGFDSAFTAMSAKRAQALVVVVDPLTFRYRGRIAELAAKNRPPAVFEFRSLRTPVGGVTRDRHCRAPRPRLTRLTPR